MQVPGTATRISPSVIVAMCVGVVMINHANGIADRKPSRELLAFILIITSALIQHGVSSTTVLRGSIVIVVVAVVNIVGTALMHRRRASRGSSSVG